MGVLPSDIPGYDISEKEREQLRRLEEIRIKENESERSAKAEALIKKYDNKKIQSDSDAK
jgi:hypothetical protein